jgi:PAS domain-containing protein
MYHQVFAPHGMCMMWNQPLIWLHVTTDSLVALSYYSIPAALFLLVRRKRENVPVRPLLILFGMFIAFCGAGHIMDIVSIWHPIYWFKGWWNAGTALTSIVTAIVLIPKVTEFVTMPERTAMLEREKRVLQQKHGILEAIMDSVSEGILLVDVEGRTLAQNPAAERILV